jgi:uncharacterized protein (TIGR03437 family)
MRVHVALSFLCVISAYAQDSPKPVIALVTNAFKVPGLGALGVGRNTWIAIYGTNLAPVGHTRTWQSSDFANGQMPTELDGVKVTFSGKSAYVYYISERQLNVLAPPEIDLPSVSVQVTNNGIASDAVLTLSYAVDPAFFAFVGPLQWQYVVARHLDGSLVGPTDLFPGLTTPAKPGETILVAGNGFGPTSDPLIPGSPTQSGTVLTLPRIRVNYADATISWAGLIGPGVYQLNLVVPPSTMDGLAPLAVLGGNGQLFLFLAVQR